MSSQVVTATQLEGYTTINGRFCYKRQKLLGKGANASVYLGYDRQLKKEIAVKHVSVKTYREHKNLIDRECQVMESLYHPNIIQYYGREVDQYDGLFIFLELCQEKDLEKMIRDRLPEEKTKKLFQQLIDGMNYMNTKNILHRDLKPQNILVSQEGDLKIADFGMARPQSNDMVNYTPFQVGTPYYSSLQLLEHTSYNELTDVYSAGYILYQMLTSEKILDWDIKEYKQKSNGIEHGNMLCSILQAKRNQGGWKLSHPVLDRKKYWLPILYRMLAFNWRERASFGEVSKMLGEVSPSGSEPELRKNTSKEEKESVIYRRRIELYLKFKDYKNQIWLWVFEMLKLPQLYCFLRIPKIYELLLLYLSLLAYCSDLLQFSNVLADKMSSLFIENEPFKVISKMMTTLDLKDVITLMDKKVIAFNLMKENARRVLQKIVIPQLKNIMKTPAMGIEREVIEELNLTNIVRSTFDQNLKDPDQVFRVFTSGINKIVGNLYVTESQLITMTSMEVRTYLTLLLLSKNDSEAELTQELNHFQAGYALNLERIAKMKVEQLLQMVKRLKPGGVGVWKKK